MEEIATGLGQAKKPLIITGSSLNQKELVRAAINLASALYKSNQLTGFSFVASECNSVGVGMLEARGFSKAMSIVSQYQKVIILENDLYRQAPASQVNEFLGAFQQVTAMDHTEISYHC